VLRVGWMEPAPKGARRNDGDELIDGRAQPFPKLDETVAFLPTDADTLGQLAPENLVLDLEELGVTRKLAIRGFGQEGEK
jgi:hypothetical protein